MIHFRTTSISGHLHALCEELYKAFPTFLFVYTNTKVRKERAAIGWTNSTTYPSKINTTSLMEEARDVPVLIDMMREISLFEHRVNKGLLTFYSNERWFKPIPLFKDRILVPGIIRLLHPRYFNMARRFARLMRSESFICLPIGVHAAIDLIRISKIFNCKFQYLFKAPKLSFNRVPGGEINGLTNIFLWSYFVPRVAAPRCREDATSLRIMWAGAYTRLKRPLDVIKAVRLVKRSCTLDVFGSGPELLSMQKLAMNINNIRIHGVVSNQELLDEMARHDLFVFSSDAREGWGAVVSEALSTGMKVLGTSAAGAVATMLNKDCQYSEGDISSLAEKIERFEGLSNGHLFEAKEAASWLISYIKQSARGNSSEKSSV